MKIPSIAVVAVFAAAPAFAADPISTAQQNALVAKYCAVCHTDAERQGGLSLQHFDAAVAPPSLKAMMVSKITGGVTLETIADAEGNESARALLRASMKSGAMGAAGIPIPDQATIDELVQALSVGAAGGRNWSVERTADGSAIASEIREAPVGEGEAESYRLIASCNVNTRSGSLQLAWAPRAQRGAFAVSVDAEITKRYQLDGNDGQAAVMLTGTGRDARLPLPAESLTVSDLFPGQTVIFSFADLPEGARAGLQACFR